MGFWWIHSPILKPGVLMTARFRGHAEARIDDKGRLKMPSAFRKSIEGAYGGALFITALTDSCLQIYPIPVWEEIETKVDNLGSMNPLRRRFLTRANRFGAELEMDSQGRVSLKPAQRSLVGIKDEVVLIGCSDHLELWPGKEMAKIDITDAFSDEDFSTLGI
jgi:MraZ protein